MKKTLIIFVNVVIISSILIFVAFYSGYESATAYKRQIEHFENITVTMEHVTENYLEGEQRICDVWANYINNKNMTIEEAADYIRASHVLTSTSAHLILLETLTGLLHVRNKAHQMITQFLMNGWIFLRMWTGLMK